MDKIRLMEGQPRFTSPFGKPQTNKNQYAHQIKLPFFSSPIFSSPIFSHFPQTAKPENLKSKSKKIIGKLQFKASMAFQSPAPATLRPSTTASALATPPILLPSKSGTAGLRLPPDSYALRSSYLSPSVKLFLSPFRSAGIAAPRFSMRVASKQAYICRDCGYIYNESIPFEKLPDKYFCPVCGAPKRRFRVYEPAVAKNSNETDVRKARKAQLKRDEAIGSIDLFIKQVVERRDLLILIGPTPQTYRQC